MAAGVEVFSSAGSLQVTSNFRNMAYADYFDVVISQTPGEFLNQKVFPNDPTYVYAFRTLTLNVPVAFATTNAQFTLIAPVGKTPTVRVYRFRRDGVGNRSNSGLEVFDAGGNLTFSSNVSYMKVQGYFTHTQWDGTGGQFSYPNKFAVVAGSMGYSSSLRLLPTLDAWRYTYRFTALDFKSDRSFVITQIADGDTFYQEQQPNVAEFGASNTNGIIIDATLLP